MHIALPFQISTHPPSSPTKLAQSRNQRFCYTWWRRPPHFDSFKLPKCVGGSLGRIIRPPAKDPTAEPPVYKQRSSQQSYPPTSDTHKQLSKVETSLASKRNALARAPGSDFPNKPRSALRCSSGNIFQQLPIAGSLFQASTCIIPLAESVCTAWWRVPRHHAPLSNDAGQ